MEERSRQQELAHLVSKAKQANQARLYQNEVEKHVSRLHLHHFPCYLGFMSKYPQLGREMPCFARLLKMRHLLADRPAVHR